MKRPHFPIGGRSGTGNMRSQGDPSDGFAAQEPYAAELPELTAIEKMRGLMSRDIALTEARVAELRDRVARGDFLTREAAEATASRLFDDNFDLE